MNNPTYYKENISRPSPRAQHAFLVVIALPLPSRKLTIGKIEIESKSSLLDIYLTSKAVG